MTRCVRGWASWCARGSFRGFVEFALGVDRLADAVNYEDVYLLIERVMRDDRFSLLEALATDLATSIYEGFEVEGVAVRVRKPSVPHCPNLGRVEIEVQRGRIGG